MCSELYLASIYIRWALSSKNDTAVGAHVGRADLEPELDLRRMTRLVERIGGR